jgi:hypothetical protein
VFHLGANWRRLVHLLIQRHEPTPAALGFPAVLDVLHDPGIGPRAIVSHIPVDRNGLLFSLCLQTPLCIAGIESGQWIYFVNVAARNDRVKVVVAVVANGDKYLKSERDSDIPTDLLTPPSCP